MSDKREFQQVDTSTNAKMDGKKEEPGLPVKIPLSTVRWFSYSFVFMILLTPFIVGMEYDWLKLSFGGMILGHFASQLNAIIKK
jgi:hypothetical protein